MIDLLGNRYRPVSMVSKQLPCNMKFTDTLGLIPKSNAEGMKGGSPWLLSAFQASFSDSLMVMVGLENDAKAWKIF